MTVNVVLTGSQEVPPAITPATGSGTFTLNADNTFTFEVTYFGLIRGLTVAHIHGSATPGVGLPGSNAGVLVNIVGGAIPPGISATPGAGSTSGTLLGSNVAASPTFLSALALGQTYFNIHSSAFPGGELRGQIPAISSPIPEPGSVLLMLGGLAVLAAGIRHRR